ncbi:MAG TPA: exodeoxyribonuclease V subunit gamma [Candidatus Aquabacterium excrementipullorum]|nr:exodeoxyribonuclease V subunit gamma [Candidatus Aquabacterium excrementipullorum]
MASDIIPGLLVLHGNRLELLRDAVFDWTGRQALRPLEEEIFLVQSNGVAEWLKMALASSRGVCAVTRVELPARFLWRVYRQVLGRASVPRRSPLDKEPLTWRLMRELPAHLHEPGFEPLAEFLEGGDVARRLQLAQRLADLYDQYEVYRADWLEAWAGGHDVLARAPLSVAGATEAVPDDQRWQPALWRDVLAQLQDGERDLSRDRIHRRFVQALNAAQPSDLPALPRRVVVFGMAHLPAQTLEALVALSAHAQVILAVPNPCRYHWADIMDGRELLFTQRRRQPLREGRALEVLPLDELHGHAHPLLAAWGRQGRDFIRQLDAFDDSQVALERFALPRIDLFDETEGDTLLAQVQARIRDMSPLPEHPRALGTANPEALAADHSIVFQVAHSAQRELEVLHDQLLALFAKPPGGTTISPRDVVVMVPNVDTVASAIQAVFGQYPRHDPRHIPFEIADQRQREHNPLLVAVDWLMRLPQQRCTLAEVRDLLDVPAVRRRLGLAEDDLPRLTEWLAGAQVRWGLSAGQRAGLGLDTCGEQNTWLFGLRRMLLGYASGDGLDFAGIEPYGEVAGLDAALAGRLAELVARLSHWSAALSRPATCADWGVRIRQLLTELFTAADERDRLTLTELDDALGQWLEASEDAGFDGELPLAAAREAWLGGVDATALNKRFMAGGVTFCTLMPMRAVPFEVVCLLGMNEGDYPRQSARNDFDLMARPGQRRPGDRARRDDDRYLMLEAVLSARQVLYISWTGRSVRDNSEQPPSVLVSQLRDYLAAGWGDDVLGQRTTEHPLQPFSRRYFEGDDAHGHDHGQALFTYAREWQAAHDDASLAPAGEDASALPDASEQKELQVRDLVAMLRNPVKLFFLRRLQVVLDDPRDQPEALDDDEPMALFGLARHQALQACLGDAMAATALGGDAIEALHQASRRLQRAGMLPLGALGEMSRLALESDSLPVLDHWQPWQQAHPLLDERRALHFEDDTGLAVHDWLDGLREPSSAEARAGDARPWRVSLPLSRLGQGPRSTLRPEALLDTWVWSLLASACGHPVDTLVLGRDLAVQARAVHADDARELLTGLLQSWREALQAPLPVACRTALAWLDKPESAPRIYNTGDHVHGEAEDVYLSRLYPDFDALAADGRLPDLAEQLYGAYRRWLDSSVTAVPLVADASIPSVTTSAAIATQKGVADA